MPIKKITPKKTTPNTSHNPEPIMKTTPKKIDEVKTTCMEEIPKKFDEFDDDTTTDNNEFDENGFFLDFDLLTDSSDSDNTNCNGDEHFPIGDCDKLTVVPTIVDPPMSFAELKQELYGHFKNMKISQEETTAGEQLLGFVICCIFLVIVIRWYLQCGYTTLCFAVPSCVYLSANVERFIIEHFDNKINTKYFQDPTSTIHNNFVKNQDNIMK